MTQFTYESFPSRLRSDLPGFDRIYDEHLSDHSEILPHVLVGSLVRFLSNEVMMHGAGSAVLTRAMALLEQAMESSDPRLQELIAVSFLENLDPADPSFPAIRISLGVQLLDQYKKYEDATGRQI